jgi:transposase
MNEITKFEAKKIYKKMGLIDVTTNREKSNGTIKFFDETSQSNYIFRENSAPRLEYLSEKTGTIQSYSLIKDRFSDNMASNMMMVIPTITNRKVKSAFERSIIAMDISKTLVKSFIKK